MYISADLNRVTAFHFTLLLILAFPYDNTNPILRLDHRSHGGHTDDLEIVGMGLEGLKVEGARGECGCGETEFGVHETFDEDDQLISLKATQGL